MPTQRFPGDDAISDTAANLREQAADAARDLRGTMSDAARSAAATAESGRAAAADCLASAASSVRDHAEDLPGGPRVQDFARTAADRMNQSADYLRDADLSRLRGDAETMVKNNPGPALLVAAMFGFLLGRALARD